jgi:hypothetical protein
MNDKFFMDSNILIYTFDSHAPRKQDSPDIIDRLMESPLPMTDGKPLSREEIYESRI